VTSTPQAEPPPPPRPRLRRHRLPGLCQRPGHGRPNLCFQRLRTSLPGVSCTALGGEVGGDLSASGKFGEQAGMYSPQLTPWAVPTPPPSPTTPSTTRPLRRCPPGPPATWPTPTARPWAARSVRAATRATPECPGPRPGGLHWRRPGLVSTAGNQVWDNLIRDDPAGRSWFEDTFPGGHRRPRTGQPARTQGSLNQAGQLANLGGRHHLVGLDAFVVGGDGVRQPQLGQRPRSCASSCRCVLIVVHMRCKYRARTWLRKYLPFVVSDHIPKGPRSCRCHEWYNSDDVVDRCYHCKVGSRPH